MEIINADAKKPIPIYDYEFKHLGMVHPTVITVFPTMGDTVKVNPDGWVFEFPRLEESQEIYRGPNLLGLLIRRQERVYEDPNEIARKIIEARKRAKEEAENVKAKEQ